MKINLKKDNKKIKLVFPPFWTVTQPYLSVPSLAAYLEKMGIKCEQYDLNLEAYDYILSSEFLSKCKYKLENQNSIDHNFIENIKDFLDYAILNIDTYKNLFRSEESLDTYTYIKCCQMMRMCFFLMQKIYTHEKLFFSEYSSKRYSDEKSKDIIKCIKDVFEDNIQNSLLLDILYKFVPDIIKDTEVVGISVTGDNQILPSFVMASIIKKINPSIKVIMGGSVVTRVIERLKYSPEIFNVVDFFLYGEGEHPLHMLVKYLKGLVDINEVPNLLYLNNDGDVIINEDNCYLPINDLPTPVFNKRDIPRYFSPTVCMPLLTSRGCYWGKCTFCDHSYIYHGKYQRRKIDLVMEDIETMCREYNCQVINFHDEAIPPVEIEDLTKALNEKNIKIKWTSCARLDLAIDKEILKNAADAGLSVLFYGLESANERILKLMNKGTQIEKVKQVLRNGALAGIWNHVFCICGFPTETMEEFEDTLNFIKENSEYIHSTGHSYFQLGYFCPIAKNPEKYQLKIVENKELDFRFWHDYVNVLPSKSKEDYFNSHVREFVHIGKYGLLANPIFRDHWGIFKDTFSKEEKEEKNENSIRLSPQVFYEYKNEHIFMYKVGDNKILTFKFNYWFKEVLKELNNQSLSEELLNKRVAQRLNMSPKETEVLIRQFVQILRKYKCIV